MERSVSSARVGERAGPDLRCARGQAGGHLRGVLLEGAELLEGLGLLIENLLGVGAELQDPAVAVAALLVGLRLRVVEPLLEGEGLAEKPLRGRERLAEGAGRVRAELRLREADLLLAGADGVVRLHEGGAGAGGELVDRRLHGLGGLPAARAADEEPHDHADDDQSGEHGEDDQEAGAERLARARGVEAGADALSGGDRGARPVAVDELGLDVVGLQCGHLAGVEGEAVVDGHLVLPGLDRDGEEDVVRAESVELGGRVRPALVAGRAGEGVDVGDEELDAVLLVELGGGGLDVADLR